MDKDARKESRKGWLFGLSGLALLIKIALESFGIEIPNEFLNDGINLLVAVLAAYGGFRNNFFGDFGRQQYQLLRKKSVAHLIDNLRNNFKDNKSK